MPILRSNLITAFPATEGRFTMRLCGRGDWDELAGWPAYPFPYESFHFSFAGLSEAERDALFRDRELDEARVTLVMDDESGSIVGYVALLEIEWKRGIIGNMSLRVHPALCGKGLGTSMLLATVRRCLKAGVRKMRLDVAASNGRAVRCYEKAGFVRTGEFWRKDGGLVGVDLSTDAFAFLRGHVRLDGETPELEFLLMETCKITNGEKA